MAKLIVDNCQILGDVAPDVDVSSLKKLYGDNVIITVHLTTEEQAAADQLHRKKNQMQGVDFNGVMCSATKDDQFGLTGMWMQYENLKAVGKAAEFVPQAFHFENGSVLVLTKDNIEAFRAVWLPFRMSFFPVPDVT